MRPHQIIISRSVPLPRARVFEFFSDSDAGRRPDQLNERSHRMAKGALEKIADSKFNPVVILLFPEFSQPFPVKKGPLQTEFQVGDSGIEQFR